MKIHSLNIHKPDSALLKAHEQVRGMRSILYIINRYIHLP
jgi:hypothetical protein